MDIANTFHIGCQRTGSTFLQQRVLLAHPDLIAHRNTAPFFFEDTLFARGIDYYRAMSKEEANATVILETHNALSGDTRIDRYDVAERIHAIQPDARIVIGVRSHHTIIPSFYFLDVKNGGTLDYPSYVETVIANGKFHFDRMVTTYQDVFGPDRVLVLPYEDLRNDAEGYVSGALRFIGIREDLSFRQTARPMKERYSDLGIRTILLLNRLLREKAAERTVGDAGPNLRRRFRKHVNGLVSAASRRLPERLDNWAHIDTASIAPRIEEIYGASNARLSELIGRDLGALGYPIGVGAPRNSEIRPRALTSNGSR
jgi:hypothetical protein